MVTTTSTSLCRKNPARATPRIWMRISVPMIIEIGSTFLRCSIWVAPTIGETTPPSCCNDWPSPTR